MNVEPCNWCCWPLIVRDGGHAFWCPKINTKAARVLSRTSAPSKIMPKLSRDEIAYARWQREEGRSSYDLAKELGVSHTTILVHTNREGVS